VLKDLRGIYQREQFYPGLLGIFINPYYFARKALADNIKALSPYIKGETLDVGCGQRPYEKIFSDATSYTGLEIDRPENRRFKKADVFYNAGVLPFGNDRFDSIVTFEVFEHVLNPDEFLREVNRVLKIGGVLLMSTAFIWDEHEQPHDYGRYTSFGLKYLLNKYDFEIIDYRKTLPDIRFVFQITAAYIYKITGLKSENIFLRLFTILIFIAPLNIMGALLSKIFPASKDLYIDNIVLAKKRGRV